MKGRIGPSLGWGDGIYRVTRCPGGFFSFFFSFHSSSFTSGLCHDYIMNMTGTETDKCFMCLSSQKGYEVVHTAFLVIFLNHIFLVYFSLSLFDPPLWHVCQLLPPSPFRCKLSRPVYTWSLAFFLVKWWLYTPRFFFSFLFLLHDILIYGSVIYLSWHLGGDDWISALCGFLSFSVSTNDIFFGLRMPIWWSLARGSASNYDLQSVIKTLEFLDMAAP